MRQQLNHGAMCLLLLAAFLTPGFAHAQLFTRPSVEVRTINTASYAFNVQKNGRVDVEHVAFGLVFENAFPMVRFADEESPEPFRLKGLASARTPVKDRLGEGQGFQFTGKDCVWLLRAYPTQPFFTVQVIYKNETRKPVSVAALYPWAIGAPNDGALNLGPGVDRAAMLTRGTADNPYPRVVTGSAESVMSLAIHNGTSQRNLIAGFLTQANARGNVEVRRSEKVPATAFDLFRAGCVFNPPKEVQPGEQLASEVLYVSVGENDPVHGLRRYGSAVDVWNGDRDSAVAQMLRAMPDSVPQWSTGFDAPAWGTVECLTAAIRRFYFTDPWHKTVMAPVWLDGPSLTEAQGRAWLTGAALSGGEVRIAQSETLTAAQKNDLQKVSSALGESARPVDLFQAGPPQVWNFPLKEKAGEWNIVALFNWDPDKITYLPLTLAELSLAPAQFYTVFDFWNEQYLGTAQGALDVEIAPGSVRVLGLRPFDGQPMVIATNQHITQGAKHLTESAWDATTGTLRGVVETTPGTAFKMWVLIPDGYQYEGHEIAGAKSTVSQDGTALVIEVIPDTHNVKWVVDLSSP